VDNAAIVKYLGIGIVVVMAISMLAAAFLYGPEPETVPDVTLTPEAVEFTYNASFDTTIITELSALRLRAGTTEIDKAKVDESLKGVSGVSKVSSKFITNSDKTWDYFADIYLSRSTNVLETGNTILSLDAFSSTQQKSAVKYATIASPGKIELINPDLNITRDFNFDGITLTSMTSLETMPGDEIAVQGTIKLKGKDITFIELFEVFNYNSIQLDTNNLISIDENTPQE